jgi:hypothetical protein
MDFQKANRLSWIAERSFIKREHRFSHKKEAKRTLQKTGLTEKIRLMWILDLSLQGCGLG